MAKYDSRKIKHQKQQATINAHRQGHLTNLASDKLKPFDWAIKNQDLAIRRKDIEVFRAAATGFHHIILVRATNPASLEYVENSAFTPKPTDCKAKTAQSNGHGLLPSNQYKQKFKQTYCAGLVADPTLVKHAFTDVGKAIKWWNLFLKDKSDQEKIAKIYQRRGEEKGFFAVDTWQQSDYYGCLMLNNKQNIPSANNFSFAFGEYEDWKRQNMRYVSGDYDLYGLIDLENEKLVKKEVIHGQMNYYSRQFHSIKEFINRAIGVPMIQHGAQDNLEHKDDLVYVFYPDRSLYIINESAASIEEIYQLVFKQM